MAAVPETASSKEQPPRRNVLYVFASIAQVVGGRARERGEVFVEEAGKKEQQLCRRSLVGIWKSACSSPEHKVHFQCSR